MRCILSVYVCELSILWFMKTQNLFPQKISEYCIRPVNMAFNNEESMMKTVDFAMTQQKVKSTLSENGKPQKVTARELAVHRRRYSNILMKSRERRERCSSNVNVGAQWSKVLFSDKSKVFISFRNQVKQTHLHPQLHLSIHYSLFFSKTPQPVLGIPSKY